MGASVIIIHSYFNVWLRAQSGWRSFLLRQEAAKKINSLPKATTEQLEQHNDVCSICFQEMSSAVITYCGHFFHGNCLRKWLYVQETCPMCHQTVRPKMPDNSQPPDEAPPVATPQNLPDEAEQHVNLPNEQSDEEQVLEDHEFENENRNDQSDSKNIDSGGLRFSSSGDFVGFISPSNSAHHIDETADTQIQSNEGVGDAHCLQIPSEVVNEEGDPNVCDSNAEGLIKHNISCLSVPQNGDFVNDECKSENNE